jgi:hypothetical protein
MITNEETWRAELKQRGVENVKLKLLVAAVRQQTWSMASTIRRAYRGALLRPGPPRKRGRLPR